MGLKIYGRLTSGNVHKVMWLVEELSIPHERVDAGGSFGLVSTPDYIKMNPNSKVPTIDDDGYYLWESNTICRYLASTRAPNHPIYPADPKLRAHVDMWMDWFLASLNPHITVLFWTYVRTPEDKRDMVAAEKARKDAEPLIRILDAQIGSNDFILGKDLTIADIVIGCFIHRWFNVPIERIKVENVERWYGKLSERPGYQKYVLGPLV